MHAEARYSLDQRTLEPSASDLARWALGTSRPLPSFFLWEGVGCNSTAERRALRAAIGNRHVEQVLPSAWAQYLVDFHLINALGSHRARTHIPNEAEWHIVAAAPFTSYVRASLICISLTSLLIFCWLSPASCRWLVCSDY